MRERVSPWADGVDDADLAYALLGLGLVPSHLRRDPAGALQALAAKLQRSKDQANRWRLDRMPSTAQAWDQWPDAASLASCVRNSAVTRPLRFALLPGSVLSTVDLMDFVANTLTPHEVALYLVGRSSRRQLSLRWPLQIGFPPGPDAEAYVAMMQAGDSWDGNIYEAFVLSRRRPECDLLVCVEQEIGATAMLERAAREVGTVRADLVVVLSRPTLAQANVLITLDEVRALVDAGGSASVQQSLDDPTDLLRSICIEMSHNFTLDVAIGFASGGRALLLASAALVDKSQLAFKARKLGSALISPAEANVVVGSPQQWGYFGRATTTGGPSAPTREKIGHYLLRSVSRFGWRSESAEASELGRVMRSLADDDAKQPAPRFLQAGFSSADRREGPLSGALEAASSYFVNVFIGAPRQGFALGDVVFPNFPPREDGRSHQLDVVFWEPDLCQEPQVRQMQLPPRGPAIPVSFRVNTGDATTAINARISVLHRNRVLQTGMLTAPVGREGPVRFELDAIPRRLLSGLDERTNFSMALVLNDVEGEGAVHAMADGKAQTFNANDPAVADLVNAIGSAISDIADNPGNYQGLDSRGTRGLLLQLAARGASMRDYLERYVVKDGKLSTPDFVQVVATRPGKVFPVEFVYDWAAPDIDAELCPNAAQALTEGDCTAGCPRHCDPQAMDKVVCPLGFWGLRCVIERKLYDNKKAASAEPAAGKRAPLKPLSSILVGASPKADAVVPKSISGMIERLRRLDQNCQQVTAWEKWPASVLASKPSTLALVVHQERDAGGTPSIEIGPPPLLPSHFLREKHVAAPESAPPIVLLIGCETALAGISYESFAVQFQSHGAAHVVSTIAGVVGRQAAPMTADILEAIRQVTEPTSFAQVIRDLRRRLLASGTPMVLSLTSEGDADWEVIGE